MRSKVDPRLKHVRILASAILILAVTLLLVFGLVLRTSDNGQVEVLQGLAYNNQVRSSSSEFETWILVQNPGSTPVHVDLDLHTDMGEMAPPELHNLEIPAGGRRSFPLHEYVQTYHVSTLVEARDGEVVCERAMYWNGRQGGHDSVGVTSPASQWYLAEGATSGEFETWILVQNPGSTPVHVDLDLHTDMGEMAPPELHNLEIP
ncbi:MAG: hypothetical protein SWK76_07775, partial [Actinomycetota bacterium]|nr:hypothetical protein [Actinomycetota bacterium]